MIETEIKRILDKKPEELTGAEVEWMEHIAKMVELDPDYLSTFLPEPQVPEAVEFILEGSSFIGRVRI